MLDEEFEFWGSGGAAAIGLKVFIISNQIHGWTSAQTG